MGWRRRLEHRMTRSRRLRSAFDGRTRTIDAGLMANRAFFNIAGIGFDARIARLFNERGAGRRGRLPYVVIGIREGCRYEGVEYAIDLDGDRRRVRALLIAFANGREYGMGARIAPQAELDDGLLDATVVEYRPLCREILARAPPGDGDGTSSRAACRRNV